VKGRLQGLLVVGALFLMVGCAAQQYKMVKNGVSAEEAAQDDAHCQMQASYIQTADWEYQGSIMEGANINMKRQKTYGLCMSSKGYSSVKVQ